MQSLLSTEILINESHFDIVVSKTIALLRPVIKNTILVWREPFQHYVSLRVALAGFDLVV